MAEPSGLNSEALNVWYAAQEQNLRHGILEKIIVPIENALKNSADSERERIAKFLEERYPYFPHIGKEIRDLK